MAINIRVITPDRLVCSTTADEVILPSTTGRVGILENHIPLVTTLDIGVLRMKLDEKWTPMILFGGFAEVVENNVTVLVNSVEETISLTASQATAALEEATLALETAETEKEKMNAALNIKKATARLTATNLTP